MAQDAGRSADMAHDVGRSAIFMKEVMEDNLRFQKRGIKKWFLHVIPFFRSLKHYTFRTLWSDFFAGIIVGSIHIPQSMGTGMAANLGPMFGIYMTFFPGIIYALLGSSFHNSVGAFAPSAALVGVAVARTRAIFAGHYLPNETVEIVGDDLYAEVTRQHLEVAVSITLMAGIVQLAMALFRLEFLSRIFSHNVLDPFNCACSLQIMLVQIPNMLGVRLDAYFGLNKHIGMLVLLFSKITSIRWLDTLLATITASIIIGFRDFIQPKFYHRLKVIIPIEFLLVVAFTGISYGLSLHEKYDVRILGSMAVGLPEPIVPSFKYMPYSFLDGILSALVSIAFCMQATKPAARKHGYRVSTKRELIGLGVANVFSSFFSCFVTSSNIGRITIQESMGARSQVASLFGCLLTGLLLAFTSQTLFYLPSSVIATIITLTLSMSLKLFADLPDIWKMCRLDAIQWILTFVACLLLDLEWGLLIGLGFSFIRIQYQFDEPNFDILGKSTSKNPLHSSLESTSNNPFYSLLQSAHGKDDEDLETARVRVIRIGQSLNFANSEKFSRRILLLVENSDFLTKNSYRIPTSLRIDQMKFTRKNSSLRNRQTKKLEKSDEFPKKNGSVAIRKAKNLEEKGEKGGKGKKEENSLPQHFILDCSGLKYIDSSGFRIMRYLTVELSKKKVSLWFASCSDLVQKKLSYSLNGFPSEQFFATVSEAKKQIISQKRVFQNGEVPLAPTVESNQNSERTEFWEVTGMPEKQRFDLEDQLGPMHEAYDDDGLDEEVDEDIQAVLNNEESNEEDRQRVEKLSNPEKEGVTNDIWTITGTFNPDRKIHKVSGESCINSVKDDMLNQLDETTRL